MNYKAVWKPLPGSQSLSLSCPCNEILYEGTRGPGKTAAQLARFRRNVGVGYRSFISTDLAAPAAVPYTLKIKSGYWTATEVQITAGYMNVLDMAWPRYRYTLPVFPGLRYIS